MKVVVVILALVACCYCLEELEHKATELHPVEDSRAMKKKKRKSNLRLWALLALAVFSKMAIFKVFSFMMAMSFFQKLFSLVGVFLGFYMNNKSGTPSSTYGPPEYSNNYNTVGYSYGPPDNDKISSAGQAYGLPNIDDLTGSFNSWLFKQN